MRVLVDSTVWIDFFRGRETAQVKKLEQCIREREDLCSCGFVLVEVLQGIHDEKEFAAAKQHFDNLIYLPDDRTTFEFGAGIYRRLRKGGITIRNSIDCLIAAVVIQHEVNFLEHDRDYRFIDERYPLNRI